MQRNLVIGSNRTGNRMNPHGRRSSLRQRKRTGTQSLSILSQNRARNAGKNISCSCGGKPVRGARDFENVAFMRYNGLPAFKNNAAAEQI